MRSIFKTKDAFCAAQDVTLMQETFHQMDQTKLVYFDEAAVRRDLVQTYPGDTLKFAGLTEWIRQAGSVLSSPNMQENGANEIPVGATRSRIGGRPPRYGRAAVFEVEMSPRRSDMTLLFDVKGCGVADGVIPIPSRRATGTLMLYDALQEMINAKVLDAIFRHAGVDVRCLPVYGIVDLGISGWCPFFKTLMPCATLVRRGHHRPDGNNEIPLSGSADEQAKHQIETVLRRYGMSSAPPSCAIRFFEKDDELRMTKNSDAISVPANLIARHLNEIGIKAPRTVHVNNVQLTAGTTTNPLSATLVDFGHYTFEARHQDHDLVTLVSDRPFNWRSGMVR